MKRRSPTVYLFVLEITTEGIKDALPTRNTHRKLQRNKSKL